MMQAVLGPIPKSMAKASKGMHDCFVGRDFRLNWPADAHKRSIRYSICDNGFLLSRLQLAAHRKQEPSLVARKLPCYPSHWNEAWDAFKLVAACRSRQQTAKLILSCSELCMSDVYAVATMPAVPVNLLALFVCIQQDKEPFA